MAETTERPLEGLTVVVTRPRHQAGSLASLLERQGASPLVVPMIEIVDPVDEGRALADAVARVHDYAWVVLTSPNGAERFCDQLRDGRDLAGVRLAAIGPGTAEVLTEHFLHPELVPGTYVAESLLAEFPLPHGPGPHRVLLARAETARDVLPDGLRDLGWQVDVVTAYRTIGVDPSDEQREQVRSADVVTFTSSSTVDQWIAAFGIEHLPRVVVCIGPVTADTARDHGIAVDVVARDHTIDGVVAALVEHVVHPPRPRRGPSGDSGARRRRA